MKNSSRKSFYITNWWLGCLLVGSGSDKWRSNSLQSQFIDCSQMEKSVDFIIRPSRNSNLTESSSKWFPNRKTRRWSKSHKFPKLLSCRIKWREQERGGNKNVRKRCKSRKTNKWKWIFPVGERMNAKNLVWTWLFVDLGATRHHDFVESLNKCKLSLCWIF